MAYLLGYCTVVFADEINIDSDEWNDLQESEKEFALTNGRLFIDQRYTCSDDDWDTDDYTTIPDEIQHANALLGDYYAKGTLVSTDIPVSGPITSKRVKAGSVESETTYLGAYSTATKKIDLKPEITMLLSPYCSIGNSRVLTRV